MPDDENSISPKFMSSSKISLENAERRLGFLIGELRSVAVEVMLNGIMLPDLTEVKDKVYTSLIP